MDDDLEIYTFKVYTFYGMHYFPTAMTTDLLV